MRDSSGRDGSGREGSGATLTDEVYERVRAGIVNGTYRPNERLIEVDLSESLDVSRTPIRECLQRLAVDGLIVSRRRGWVVREHTLDEIAEIYDVRAALEGYAARLAATRADDATLRHVAEIHRAVADDSNRAARERLVDGNDKFHHAIIEATGNRRLGETIRRSCEYYFNYRIANLYSDDEARQSIAGHGAIVAALLDRNPDAAETAARAHVSQAMHDLISKMR